MRDALNHGCRARRQIRPTAESATDTAAMSLS
jgi:hypothetical protein